MTILEGNSVTDSTGPEATRESTSSPTPFFPPPSDEAKISNELAKANETMLCWPRRLPPLYQDVSSECVRDHYAVVI